MEDDDIVSVLLAMQSVDRPEWQEKVSAVYSQAADVDDQAFDSVATDMDGHASERRIHDMDRTEADEADDSDEGKDDEDDEDESQNNEIGDILAASQAAFGLDPMDDDEEDTNDGDMAEANDARNGADARANTNGGSGAWWEVAETESQLSTDSFSEVGSARTSSSPLSSVASRAQQLMHQVRIVSA